MKFITKLMNMSLMHSIINFLKNFKIFGERLDLERIVKTIHHLWELDRIIQTTVHRVKV